MSSGEDRTHHWLLTSPGPGEAVVEEDPMVEEDPPAPLHYPLAPPGEDPLAATSSDAPDEGIVSSPVNSLDLDRDSPLGGALDDDDDDGPPSIETQLPENVDDLEVSGITSTWISSGGSHYGTTHPGLGYSVLNNEQPDADSTGLSEMPGLEPGDFGVGPVYGPHMPGSFSSPVHDPEILSYGDVADDNAVSGICGLRNLGNTCFMAAGIQCLVNTPPIAEYFFSHHHTHNNNNVNYSLAAQFSQLTHKIWCGKYSSLRPADFKDAFGQQWRDFRDYRQHDCQEFVTLLLETLRKQMCLTDDGGGGKGLEGSKNKKIKCAADSVSGAASSSSSTSSSSSSSNSRSSSSSSSSTSSNNNNSSRPEGSQGSQHSYSSPSSPQSPHCPASPPSPRCPHSPGLLKQPLELRSDSHEEAVGLDSGAASPKSSVSSSSVDAHLVNLRLQPIPEEVRALGPCCRMNTSCDDLSLAGTTSCHDAESVASDVSDPAEVSSGSVRRYNQLGSGNVGGGGSSGGEACDGSDCDISSTCNLVPPSDLLRTLPCDSLSDVEKNHIQESLRQERASQQHQLQEEEKEASTSQVCVAESSEGVGCSASDLPHTSLVKLEDIMKESKTSNVNVLVKDNNPPNNELLFDSEKYAKYEKTRLKNSLDNLCKSGVKRVKEVNLLQDGRGCRPSSSHSGAERDDGDERDRLTINKRMRLDEKNVQYELEKSQGSTVERAADSSSSTSATETHAPPQSPSRLSHEQRQADLTWQSFVGEAKSTVVDTFYGQFRSSLVCSVCGHTSVKYDPFGTLSVPLPYANQIQITVVYVPSSGSPPTRYLITLCKVSYVGDLKAALCKVAALDSPEHLVVAEVFDNHIARIVEDGYMTKFLNYNLRSIYTFHLPPPPPSIEEEVPVVASPPVASDKVLNIGPEKGTCRSGQEGSGGGSESGRVGGNHWRSCTICLEEMCQTELKTHHTCEACLLCDGCIEMSCKHQGGGESLSCPVCQTSLSPADLIPVERRKIEKPKARILRVPLVFRMDQESDNNNKRCMQLLGHPALLALPSRLSPATLTQTLAPRIPPGTSYSLLFVDGRGYNCSRCLFSSHCRGCEVLGGEEVVLQAGDTLCVRFTALSQEHHQTLATTIDHPSLNDLRQNVPLTLYDCLRAFTQSETLEEADSWFCPVCDRKQQATKTISVWRYPPYLILHLERFLFHGTMSTKLDDKVIFPLDGLDLSDYVAGETNTNQLYNLYACVCHMGVAQAGHYTAFARSPVTGDWHYFNDDSVTRQKPREEEYSTSYLLFYHRQGTNFDLHLPQHFALVESSLPKVIQQEAEAEVGCSSRASPGDFIGPMPALDDVATAHGVDDGQGQPPVFQINKIIDNLSEDCEKDNTMEE